MTRAASAHARHLLALFVGLAFTLGGVGVSRADLRREGTWPADDQELVTFSAPGLPRAEAIRQLADKAGWSVVVETPSVGNVEVRVKQQPAARVLELILGSGAFVARREGSLVSIGRAGVEPPDTSRPSAPEPARVAPSVSAAPALASALPRPARQHAEDRVVAGSSIVIRRDEVVHDLAVFGGSADLYGRVTGDASIFGGSLTLEPGSQVEGDIATFGGSAHLKEGARVDGEVSSLGGTVQRDSPTKVETEPSDDDAEAESDLREARRDHEEARGEALRAKSERAAERSPKLASLASKIGSALTRSALLFAFGVILWSLTTRRVEALQGELVARPMRAFALGSVGALASLLLIVALCVTLVGIPLALIALCATIFAVYAGICAALTAAGAALLRQKTKSPYAHLAAGCALYLLLSSVPFLGNFVTVFLALTGFGALVATRAAGLVPRRTAPAANWDRVA